MNKYYNIMATQNTQMTDRKRIRTSPDFMTSNLDSVQICTWPRFLLVKGTKVKGQSWGFTSRSTARVILGQVLRIATCGTRTHRGDSL